MTALGTELLERILTGSGRVYSHEAKAMAAEILAYRKAAQEAAAKAAKAAASPQPLAWP